MLCVAVGEARHVIRIGRHDRAHGGDPVDLSFGGVREVHDHTAVVWPGSRGHAALEYVEHHVEPKVAVDVNVELPPRVPVGPRVCLQSGGFHEPLAAMVRVDQTFGA